MGPKVESSWLDIGVGENDRLFVQDHGRLKQLVLELANKSQQSPMLSIFFGRKTKDTALQALFPQNNIRRTKAASTIGLHSDIISAKTEAPMLFTDSKIESPLDRASRPQSAPGMVDHPIPWGSGSVRDGLQFVYARLIFLFTNLICIFGKDFSDLEEVAQFLVNCVRYQWPSTLPLAIQPRVIVVLDEGLERRGHASTTTRFFRKLSKVNPIQMSQSFSAINMIYLEQQETLGSTQYNRLRTWIKDHQRNVQIARKESWSTLNAIHLVSLFDIAMKQFSSGVTSPFNFVKATQEQLPVSPGLSQHFSSYLKAITKAGCQLDTLISTTASALVMDNFPPGMPCTYTLYDN
ncbi:hypothetical protein CNMCM5623_005906 [Aspergillus felis]|uniref:Uncharacterized protein n=1 Tax=Aspergillus felis TaxID=1287682 RepID=A0A8H6V0M5_9EURO|nr:hypothetical protein CNMCM5623_005906 [Aspergillus felis]